jgi:hypothetical protein
MNFTIIVKYEIRPIKNGRIFNILLTRYFGNTLLSMFGNSRSSTERDQSASLKSQLVTLSAEKKPRPYKSWYCMICTVEKKAAVHYVAGVVVLKQIVSDITIILVV